MRCTASDMNFGDFARRFLFHVTSATAVLLTILLIAERMIPGFVTPFIDLPGLGLITFVMITITLICHL